METKTKAYEVNWNESWMKVIHCRRQEEENQTQETRMANPIQLTDDQFRQLLQAATARPVEPPNQGYGGAGMVAGAAALVGEMPRCPLGKDKLKRFKRWKEWLADAENKMAFLNITQDRAKLSFLRSCAGSELTEFWEKEARIRMTPVEGNEALGIVAAESHTYAEVI